MDVPTLDVSAATLIDAIMSDAIDYAGCERDDGMTVMIVRLDT